MSSTHTTISSFAGMVSTSSFILRNIRGFKTSLNRITCSASTSLPPSQNSSWNSSHEGYFSGSSTCIIPNSSRTLFWIGVPVSKSSHSYGMSITLCVVWLLTSLSLCASSTTHSAHSKLCIKSVKRLAVSKETSSTSNFAGPFPRPFDEK